MKIASKLLVCVSGLVAAGMVVHAAEQTPAPSCASGCGSEAAPATCAPATTPAATTVAAAFTEKPQTTCPVMGGTVSTNLFVDVEGFRVYVCCKSCVKTVKKDPKKYLDVIKKNGETPAKAPVAEPAKK